MDRIVKLLQESECCGGFPWSAMKAMINGPLILITDKVEQFKTKRNAKTEVVIDNIFYSLMQS